VDINDISESLVLQFRSDGFRLNFHIDNVDRLSELFFSIVDEESFEGKIVVAHDMNW
jgi:hypothetical protein